MNNFYLKQFYGMLVNEIKTKLGTNIGCNEDSPIEKIARIQVITEDYSGGEHVKILRNVSDAKDFVVKIISDDVSNIRGNRNTLLEVGWYIKFPKEEFDKFEAEVYKEAEIQRTKIEKARLEENYQKELEYLERWKVDLKPESYEKKLNELKEKYGQSKRR